MWLRAKIGYCYEHAFGRSETRSLDVTLCTRLMTCFLVLILLLYVYKCMSRLLELRVTLKQSCRLLSLFLLDIRLANEANFHETFLLLASIRPELERSTFASLRKLAYTRTCRVHAQRHDVPPTHQCSAVASCINWSTPRVSSNVSITSWFLRI